MGVAERRRSAVADIIGKVREVEQKQGVNRAALEEIRATLLRLATEKNLFPRSEFAPPEEAGKNCLYLLSEDPDHRYALYLSSALPGKSAPPHNHTTWAVIVGVEGDEENRFYQRSDDPARPGKSSVTQIDTKTVRPGAGVCLMPDDIHSIHVTGTQPTLHLHMYGKALDHMPHRVMFDARDATFKAFPPNSDIRR
ncbi:MAG: hypothetical protein EXQ96_04850 [Alphaproteobacteria bacterium]|nr:hypothetical protein [Alphaproteobacteria bacterium]